MFPKQLHHTYIVTGPKTGVLPFLTDFLKERFNISSNYPDLWIKEYESIGVDDAHEIAQVHMRKAIGNQPKFLIIAAQFITIPAQNSLLKMLEEPAPQTYFFIVLPSAASLLQTVLSRAHVVHLPTEDSSIKNKQDVEKATEFLKSTLSQRLTVVADFLSQYEKETLQKEDVFQFINQVEHIGHEVFINKKSTKAGNDKHELAFLQTMTQVQEYARDTSSSLKLILEYLALMMPRT